MAKVKVTQQEAGAIRRFRVSADAQHIRNVLMKELFLTREDYEDTMANEETRLAIVAAKRIMSVLFDDELERADNE